MTEISDRGFRHTITIFITADSLLIDTNISISSFGVDEQNELYVVHYGGEVFRFSGDDSN